MMRQLLRSAVLILRFGIFAFVCVPVGVNTVFAQAGTEGASFLDIPVGGRPAALGGAYAAQAYDAYAPVYNPAGLGFLQRNELAGMHLSYLDSVNYEYLSFVHPISIGHSLGASIQYLRPGDIEATDNAGKSIGTFGGSYAAYSLAYGHSLGDHWSFGASGKLIRASISSYSADAYGLDLGTMYAPFEHLTFAAVVANIGTKLTFLNDGDSLPMGGRLAASYFPVDWLGLNVQGDYDATHTAVLRTGVECDPMPAISLRAGYKTDTTRELSPMAGITAGLGLHFWGQELDYAWVPLGDLGNTQYFSLVLRWGQTERAKRNLIRFVHRRPENPTDDKEGFWSVYNFDEYELPPEGATNAQPRVAATKPPQETPQ